MPLVRSCCLSVLTHNPEVHRRKIWGVHPASCALYTACSWSTGEDADTLNCLPNTQPEGKSFSGSILAPRKPYQRDGLGKLKTLFQGKSVGDFLSSIINVQMARQERRDSSKPKEQLAHLNLSDTKLMSSSVVVREWNEVFPVLTPHFPVKIFPFEVYEEAETPPQEVVF